MRQIGSVLLLLVLLSPVVHSQWLNYAPPGTPRTRDGKINLAAPTPRTADGKPDLSGVWFHERTSPEEMKRLYGATIEETIKVDVPGMEIGTQHKYAFNIFIDYKPEDAPLRPKTAELFRQIAQQRDPSNVCMQVFGFPLAGLLSLPIKIVQAPQLTMVLYEAGYLHRQIYTDGRRLPKEFELPAYLGYSAGHWERDTFVVETAGFNDKTRLDAQGHPHSEALRVVERFHRRDFGHLDLEMTLDDPEMYTKPFTIKVPHELIPDNDIFELFCNENEKDRAHLKQP